MSEPLLEASQVAKTFLSGTREIEVLSGVNLALFRGETLSIRGESGCGKTTLLNILAGLEACESGTVAWEGRLLSDWSARRLASWRGRFMGLVFQSYHLVPELNPLENVLLPARMQGGLSTAVVDRARALLDRVGLGQRMEHRVIHLSGGERQRVAVARALINQPALLLADEPTGNLDEASGQRVMDLLMEVCGEEGASLLLVTHNPLFAARADRALTLKGGTLTQ